MTEENTTNEELEPDQTEVPDETIEEPERDFSGAEVEYLTYKKVIEEQTDQAKLYHDKTIRLELVEKLFNYTVLFLFVFLLIPNWFRDISPFGEEYSVLTVAFVAILFMLLDFLISLPLSYYSETIERDFEFATRTNREWMLDKLKELGISLVILTVVIEAVFAALHFQEDIWWIYAFLGYFVFAGVLSALSPFLISIFTKVEPLPESKVRSTVENLAQQMNLDYEEIYLWNMSEQTTKANAAVAGFGSTIRIMLGDTLIEKFRNDEIEVVMAHEIAHQQNRDVYRGILFTGIISLVAFYIIDLGFESAISWLDLTGKDDPAAIGYFILALTLIMEILGKLNLWYTRRREKAADLVAIDQVRDIEVFESAFARLGKQNLSFPNPSKLEVLLRYSHPPILDRIEYGTTYYNTLDPQEDH